jgi:CBS domain containing-hemolysin-like protein
MERLADGGDDSARRMLGILDSSDQQNSYLATAQLGITIVTLALAMYGEPAISHVLEPILEGWLGEVSPELLHTISYFIALGTLTYLHVVVGEMVPKSIALTTPNELAIRLDPTMKVLQKIFDVPIRLLNGIGSLLLRMLRISAATGHSRLYSAEEIEQLVSESTEGGLIAEETEAMIRRIFDFSERTVGMVMTPRRKIQAIPVDMPYDELVDLVIASRHSRLPVYEGDLDHVIGTLYLKDLVRRYVESDEPATVREMMRPSLPVVPEDHSAEQMLLTFKSERLHQAIVLDEFGGVVGLVTLEDLVEEVVGEVRDEFDIENEPYITLAPGMLEITGDYLIEDLREQVYLGDRELPDVDTVGGLIVTMLGRPPRVQDVVQVGENVTMTVIEIDGRAVSRAKVEFPAMNSAENAADESSN